MPEHRSNILLLLGPTAGGKTALSVATAAALAPSGECILADSMQVYRGMVIGTAQPTAAGETGSPALAATKRPGCDTGMRMPEK